MADRPQISGNQGAMIYLAESLAGLKHAQDTTNQLLRELIELARLGAAPASGSDDGDGISQDDIAGLSQFLQPATPPTTK